MTLTIGSRLGPYEIVSPLGRGGMGEIYRARDPRLSRDVAIKVLPTAASDNPGSLRRFEQEARAAAALNHPNILAIHDFGTQDGIQYVVSELLVGHTLRDVLSGGALPTSKTVEYAVQIATGLAAAHDEGIIHRDLKPENLFVTRDGRVKILDFGLAKLLDVAETGPDASLNATRIVDTMPASCSARRGTWPLNRCAVSARISGRTFLRSASPSTRCCRAAAPSRSRRRSRR